MPCSKLAIMVNNIPTSIRKLGVFGFFLVAVLLPARAASSCSMSPENYALDTIAPGVVEVTFSDSIPRKDTTYFHRLADTLVAIMRMNMTVAIARVQGSDCVDNDSDTTNEPFMRCSVSVQVDSTLKGPLQAGQNLAYILYLTDFPDFYVTRIGQKFLLYQESLTQSNINIRPPCYSFEHGFFVNGRTITSRRVALGHSLTLDSLARLSGSTSVFPGKGGNRKSAGRRGSKADVTGARYEVSTSGRRVPVTESDSRPHEIRFPIR